MGQASLAIGQGTRRFYRTQEIAHEPNANEWESLGHWTVEVDEGVGPLHHCEARSFGPFGTICCAADEGACSVEEVLVVHHDALKKVNFLLRVDELSGCELPTVPECVIAAKRAELQRRHLAQIKDTASEYMEDETAVGGPLGHLAYSPSAPMRSCVAEDDEDDMGDGFSSSATPRTDRWGGGTSSAANPSHRDCGATARRCCGPATQPNLSEEGLDSALHGLDDTGLDELAEGDHRMCSQSGKGLPPDLEWPPGGAAAQT